MNTFTYIVIFSLIGSVFSLVGGILLLSNDKLAKHLAYYGTPFAAGALLAAVFLDLLKEGIESTEAHIVLVYALTGILIFFFAERFLRWFHHHHNHEDSSNSHDPNTLLIIVGDTLHNALDGVAIAASFLVSIPTGIVTTLAIAAHEIPQEIGDFGLLLSKGMRRKKVLMVNLLSALATLVFAVITYFVGTSERLPIGALLGLSAGFLLYIAMSDIIPSIHENVSPRKLFDARAVFLVLGVVIVGVSVDVAHRYIDKGQSQALCQYQTFEESAKNGMDCGEYSQDHSH